jgi:tryptophan synthase beta chain
MTKQKKFILAENEIPTQWYNILADMPNKPLPPIHPVTKQPLTWQDLAHIFPEECSKQELDMEHRWIDIP